MPFIITAKHEHPRGKVYAITATHTRISLLFTFHALERMKRWDLTDAMVVEALLDPEEVLRGHRNRFIAHRRRNNHIIRIIYEYAETIPTIVTVYYPYAQRYYEGERNYEDRILA